MNNLTKKVLIVAIPTYLTAFLTEAMVYTLLATSLYIDSQEVDNRIDEDGDGDGDDGVDGQDGQDGQDGSTMGGDG